MWQTIQLVSERIGILVEQDKNLPRGHLGRPLVSYHPREINANLASKTTFIIGFGLSISHK